MSLFLFLIQLKTNIVLNFRLSFHESVFWFMINLITNVTIDAPLLITLTPKTPSIASNMLTICSILSDKKFTCLHAER